MNWIYCALLPFATEKYRVRAKVICYKAGEVAYIENIMAGKMKERSTRRLQHTEDSYSSSTERETTQEKDSQTTERFELQREMKDVISSDISVNGNMSVMSGDGVTTKVEVSGGFAMKLSRVALLLKHTKPILKFVGTIRFIIVL